MKNFYQSGAVRQTKTSIFVRGFFLMLTAFAFSASVVPAQTAKPQMKITIYLPSPDETVSDCGAVRAATRKIAPTKQTANAALTLLFAEPLAAEKSAGVQSLATLGDYYVGVTIKKGTAIVNFRTGAEKFLFVSGPICRQTQVLTAIEKTLLQFASIKSVEYAIDNVIIEDWDA